MTYIKLFVVAILFVAAWPRQAAAQTTKVPAIESIKKKLDSRADDTPGNVLSPGEWRRVDSAVDRGLAYLASQQQPNGSFPSLDHAQPAVTSLCVLAFMAHGHTPGSGPYGERLERAIKYIAECQKPNGLIILSGSDEPEIDRNIDPMIGVTGTYNHAIASLTLAELYGMSDTKKVANIERVIGKSLQASLQMQRWPKDFPEDKGGWRYIHDFNDSDSDLSVSGWHLMFLRSARNAGFNVPDKAIADAVDYIRRTFSRQHNGFTYYTRNVDMRSRGMAGAGILALAHAGFHNSAEAKAAAESLLTSNFDPDNEPFPRREHYHYALFLCCQGMYQMGSPYWDQFFPRNLPIVLAQQSSTGAWAPKSYQRDRQYGTAYTTAMVILALGAPNQLLPIFQR